MRILMEDSAQIRDAAPAVQNAFGRADILIDSAGFTRMISNSDLESLDDDLIDAILTANVRGPSRWSARLLRCCGSRAMR
jgi:3-oxoacyl-[acyl-carrier protein] reductase